MSKKSRQLKNAIDDIEREIEEYERKRERSQNAIMRAMISGDKPSAEDQQYFTVFSNLIDNDRAELRKLYKELDELNKK